MIRVIRKFTYLHWFLFVLFVLGLFVRIYLVAGGNLFFTVDQGRDAVYVREILTRHKIFLKGPETNIRGIFAGPLGDYFIAFGYLFTGGHPIGATFVIILLNLFATVFLILWLRKKVGNFYALLVGFSLQIFWPFFETSLWGFHPFPLVALSLLLLVFLVRFIEGKERFYYFSAIPIFLAFNVEVAGALALFTFYLLVGIYGVRKRLITFKKYLILAVIPPLLGAIFFGREFLIGLFNSKLLGREGVESGASAGRVFSTIRPIEIAREFLKMLGSITIPQNIAMGLVLLFVIFVLFWKNRNNLSKALYKFIILSWVLFVVSFLFFASNNGWRSWHTVYLAPLLFISILLMLKSLPAKLSIFLFGLILIFQTLNFTQKYTEYLKPSNNPSLLYNQLSVIDWIYEKSHDQGFRVYNYTDTFYDYPYQYLFWWYGLKEYGYLPDEYSNFPLSHKGFYVPGFENYQNPKRSGEDLKYLIIESSTNGEDNKDWPEEFRKYHNLIEETRVGDIKIQKYLKKLDAPNDLCIWWDRCKIE